MNLGTSFAGLRARLLVVSVLLCGALAFMTGAPDPLLAGQSEGILGEGVTKTAPTGEEQKAEIEKLKKRIEATPDNYRLHYDLGNLLADAGQRAEAKAAYERAIAQNPKHVESLVNLGSLLTDMGMNKEAIEAFEKALGLDPEDCKARSNLGNAYYSMARYPDAMYEYRRAIEIDAECYPALYNIGVAFADAGMFREAVSWWKKVVKIAPNSEAGRNAEENIEILDRFVAAPIPPIKDGAPGH